jgi:ferric-dicitrate binding protein FerR (iron transport regulator)
MNDPQHDPELNWMRSSWTSQSAPSAMDDKVLAAYRKRLVRRRWSVWYPVAALALAGSLALALIQVRPSQNSYQPVAEPRIIDLSQGERP